MKLLQTITASIIVLVSSVICQAGTTNYIVSAGAADDGDGVVLCPSENNTWNLGDQVMTVVGDHVVFGTGHIGNKDTLDNTAYFTALYEDDPTVTLMSSIDNDTDFAWTGYNISVYMPKTFTLSLPTVSTAGWTVEGTYPVTATLVGDKYVASVNFTTGTPLAIGGTLDFGYKLSFDGSVNYCQEMTPIAVPEPSSTALGIVGLVSLLVVRRKFVR